MQKYRLSQAFLNIKENIKGTDNLLHKNFKTLTMLKQNKSLTIRKASENWAYLQHTLNSQQSYYTKTKK